MADHWVHYDAEGNRVSPAQARFLGKEVEIGVGGSTRPGNDPLRRYRYTDVHAIGSSERHTFDSWRKFRAWCREQSSKRPQG
jgi:hypothetical protein